METRTKVLNEKENKEMRRLYHQDAVNDFNSLCRNIVKLIEYARTHREEYNPDLDLLIDNINDYVGDVRHDLNREKDYF